MHSIYYNYLFNGGEISGMPSVDEEDFESFLEATMIVPNFSPVDMTSAVDNLLPSGNSPPIREIINRFVAYFIRQNPSSR